jgi:hypothetical protein
MCATSERIGRERRMRTTGRRLAAVGVVLFMVSVVEGGTVPASLAARLMRRFDVPCPRTGDPRAVLAAGTPLLDGQGCALADAEGQPVVAAGGVHELLRPWLPVAGGTDLLLRVAEPGCPIAFVKKSAIAALATESAPLPAAPDRFNRMSARELAALAKTLGAQPTLVHARRTEGTFAAGRSFSEYGWAHDELPGFLEGALSLPGHPAWAGEAGFVLADGDIVLATGVRRTVHAIEGYVAPDDHTFVLCFVKLADGDYLGLWIVAKDL